MKFLSEFSFLAGSRTKIGAWLVLAGVLINALLGVLPGLAEALPWAPTVIHALTPIGGALAALGIRYKGSSPTP